MAFEKFKNAIKSMSLDDLNREIQERKKTLLKWNKKSERSARNKHPHRKIKKELAILNIIVHQRLNKG